MSASETIVIGAGPAGLACAACPKPAGVTATIPEKADAVGAVWRRHYDRLHLHTDRDHSGLPGLAMPKSYPRYPARSQVVEYLERYADEFGLRPRFGVNVERASRESDGWRLQTSAGSLAAPTLIMATGLADWPYRPYWPGEERFGVIFVTAAPIATRRRTEASACWWWGWAIRGARSHSIWRKRAWRWRFRCAAA